jgi:hypothetical protein
VNGATTAGGKERVAVATSEIDGKGEGESKALATARARAGSLASPEVTLASAWGLGGVGSVQ